jgi:hypothetical protein
MKIVMVFIAGAMLLSTAFGNDLAKQGMNSAKHGCCAHHQQQAAVTKSAATLGDPGAEARFQMKFGRTNRATSEPVLVAAANMCQGACCKHGQ